MKKRITFPILVILTFVLTACGTTLRPNFPAITNTDSETPTVPGLPSVPAPSAAPSFLVDTAFGQNGGAIVPGYSASSPVPTSVPFDYDQNYVASPYQYLNSQLPSFPIEETRALATLGSHVFTFGLSQSNVSVVSYQVVLGSGIDHVTSGICNVPLSGNYTAPVSLCLNFTTPSLVPTYISVTFSGGGLIQTRILRLIVLPPPVNAPVLEVADVIVPFKKTLTGGMIYSGAKLTASTSNGSFRVKANYDGIDIVSAAVSPAPLSIVRDGADYLVTVSGPGLYRFSAVYPKNGVNVPVNKNIAVNGEYIFQFGGNGEYLPSGSRGVISCSNALTSNEPVGISAKTGSSTSVDLSMVVAAGATQTTAAITPISRTVIVPKGSIEYRHVQGSLLVGGAYRNGVECVMNLYDNATTFSALTLIAAYPIQ